MRYKDLKEEKYDEMVVKRVKSALGLDNASDYIMNETLVPSSLQWFEVDLS